MGKSLCGFTAQAVSQGCKQDPPSSVKEEAINDQVKRMLAQGRERRMIIAARSDVGVRDLGGDEGVGNCVSQGMLDLK